MKTLLLVLLGVIGATLYFLALFVLIFFLPVRFAKRSLKTPIEGPYRIPGQRSEKPDQDH